MIEARRAGKENLAVLGKLQGGVGRLRKILFGQLLQPNFAVNVHEDVDHQRDQCLVGANVRGRLFAANVLLAVGQSEYKTALATPVGGWSDEAAGNLAAEFFARANHST